MAANRLRITLHDGRTIDVQTTLQDRLEFETTLRRNKGWGSLSANALKLHPFMAWNAARRAGLLDLTWQEFTTGDTAALDVEQIDEDDEPLDDDEAGPVEVDGLGEGTPPARSTTYL